MILLFFHDFTKIKLRRFECPKSKEIMKTNNAWNIRCLVDESFVPALFKIVRFPYTIYNRPNKTFVSIKKH